MRPALPLLRAAAGGVLLLALAGCAGRGAFPRRPAPESLPEGSPLLSATLAEGDAWLRHYLMEGAYDSALAMLVAGARAAPRDDLVRSLQLGLVLHQAGRWAESNDAFEWAEREAEDRVTRSATRALGSLLVNDGTLEYVPSATERAMLPYYRMLNYLALADRAEATVEARKAAALLAAADAKPGCSEAFLQYLGGMVFQAAGERNDALVSLRRSEAAYDACGAAGETAAPTMLGEDLFRAAASAGVGEVADSARSRYRIAGPAAAGETGDLVLLLEHGWVAHRAAEDVHVPLFPEEVDGLDGDDDDGVSAAAGRISARLLGGAAGERAWGPSWSERPDVRFAAAVEGGYVLKFAWPVYRLEASRPAALRVLVDDSAAAPATVEDVSTRVSRDFDGRRAGVLTRAVGRGVLKLLVAREAEKKAEKKGGEAAGFVVGRLLNLAGNALERPDLRSWSLLPDRISLARLALPAGEHRVRVEVRRGGWDGAGVDTVDVGTVTVRAGERVFVSRRVWGDEPGGAGEEGDRRGRGHVVAGTFGPGWGTPVNLPRPDGDPRTRAKEPEVARPADAPDVRDRRADLAPPKPRVAEAEGAREPEREPKRTRPEPPRQVERGASSGGGEARTAARVRPQT